MATYVTERDARLERVIQRLEEACTRVQTDPAIVLLRRDSASARHVPERIREIVDACLARSDGAPTCDDDLARENQLLEDEVKRVEALLRKARREREDLGEKYVAVSSKLERIFQLEQEVDVLRQEKLSFVDQMTLLQKQLVEKERRHQVHVKRYEDERQKQAILVQKLQAKLLQYKRRNTDLVAESRQALEKSTHLEESMSSLEFQLSSAGQKVSRLQQSHDEELQGTLLKLKEKEKITSDLKSKLAESKETNQRLVTDIHKLTADWQQSRELLQHKDQLHKNELRVKVLVEKTKWREDLARLLPIVSLLRSDHNDIKSRAQRNIELMRGFVCESVKSLGNSIERRERHWERKCEEIADKLREVSLDFGNERLKFDKKEKELIETVEGRENQLAKLEAEKREIQVAFSQSENARKEVEARVEDLLMKNEELLQELQGNQDRRRVLESSCSVLQETLKKITNSMKLKNSTIISPPLLDLTERVSPLGVSANSFERPRSQPNQQTSTPVKSAGVLASSSGSSLASDLDLGESQVSMHVGGRSSEERDGGDSGVETVANEAWAAVKGALTSHNVNRQELEGQIVHLNCELQETRRRIESSERERSALTKAIEVLKTDLETSQCYQQEKTAECQTLETKYQALNDRCDLLEGEGQTRVVTQQTLEQHVEKLQLEVQDFVEERERMTQSNGRLDETNEQLAKEVETLKSTLEKSEREVTSRGSRIDEVERKLDDVRKRLTEAEERFKTGQSQIEKLEEEKEGVVERLTETEVERKSLEGVVETLRSMQSTWNEEKGRLMREKLELEAEKRKWVEEQTERQDLIGRLKAVEEMWRKSVGEASDMKLRVSSLEKELKLSQNDKEMAEQNVQRLQVKLSAEKAASLESLKLVRELEGGTPTVRNALQLEVTKKEDIISKMTSQLDGLYTSVFPLTSGTSSLSLPFASKIAALVKFFEEKPEADGKRGYWAVVRERDALLERVDAQRRANETQLNEMRAKIEKAEAERFHTCNEAKSYLALKGKLEGEVAAGTEVIIQLRTRLGDVESELKRSRAEWEVERCRYVRLMSELTEKSEHGDQGAEGKLRKRVRELEAKVASLQSEVTERRRKKRQYCSEITKKDKEVKELRLLLGESLQQMMNETASSSRDVSLNPNRSRDWKASQSSPAMRVTSPLFTSTPQKY